MESIGKILKRARLQKGQTVEELQQATKIQKKHLLAIEKDDFSALPSSYYSKTFIKQYAAEVGVNGDYLINIFEGKETKPQKKVAVANHQRANNQDTPVNAQAEAVKSNLPLVLLFLASLLIILVIGFMTLKDPGSKAIIKEPDVTEANVPKTTESQGTEETQSTELEEETTETKEMGSEELSVAYLGKSGYDSNFEIKNVESDISVELEAINETCWVGIQVDGEYVKDEMLDPGKKLNYTFSDSPKKVGIVVGNVSNMKIKMNGQSVDYNPEKESAIKKNVNFEISYL